VTLTEQVADRRPQRRQEAERTLALVLLKDAEHVMVPTTPRYTISIVKTALLLMLAGALLGAAVASFLVPPMLSWYTSPGGLPQGAQIPAVVQIPEVIRYATSRLLLGQAIGGGIGAMAGLMVSFSLRRKPSTPKTVSLPTSR
jgi:hypothetical protein